ncbi:MAG: HAMP domain-containing histidine kinase [Thermotogaceae bacterium]|nr:HAMP domain-containing histidine kinase [Thermotogaceae bacterium]
MRQRKIHKRILLTIAFIYVLSCIFYTRYITGKEQQVYAYFSGFLSSHAWQFDVKNLSNMADSIIYGTNVYRIVVIDDTGEVLYDNKANPGTLSKVFLKVGIYWLKKHQFEMKHDDEKFGQIVFYSLRKDFNVYTYFFIAALGLYLIITNQINLREALKDLSTTKGELEETVEELENTIEELNNTQEELINSEKMASIGRFVAGIAHDLNTPAGIIYTGLTELQRYLEELEESYKNGKVRKKDFEDFLSSSKELVDMMIKNITRIASLVKGLKGVAFQEAGGKPLEVNLKNLINDVISAISPKLKRSKVKVEISCPDGLQMRSYPSAISQVLMNLTENSLSHGFDGDVQNPTIRIKVEDKGDYVQIIYEDNGRGMSEDVRRKAFEPFYTTKPGKGGTGLGLYIVYTLVEDKLAGEITLESESGLGARFLIILPKNLK